MDHRGIIPGGNAKPAGGNRNIRVLSVCYMVCMWLCLPKDGGPRGQPKTKVLSWECASWVGEVTYRLVAERTKLNQAFRTI